jgi:hypothetical protein
MERQENQEIMAQRRYPPYRSGTPTQEERPYLEALGQVLRHARRGTKSYQDASQGWKVVGTREGGRGRPEEG